VTSLPNKAFLDTTILADALLKQRGQGPAARAALTKFQETQLPVYAIKEFKAGILSYYVWFHNKVVVAPRWEDVIDAIRSLWRQRNRQAAGLQALSDFESSIGKAMPARLAAKYPHSDESAIKKDEARLWLKTLIMSAWRKRRSLTTRVVAPLSCYPETDIVLSVNGTLDARPVDCPVDDCCLREPLSRRQEDLKRMFEAIKSLPDKEETMKRRHVLKQLSRTPKRPLSPDDCRNLGDAVFALQCPADAVILTTNIVDHEPLARAVGRTAATP
jgi:hypothetical protein